MSETLTTTPSLTELTQRVDGFLVRELEGLNQPKSTLTEAMHYVVTAGGKRMRPLLVYASGLTFGAELSELDYPAAAVELIHAYSLTHDDLPAMDDDDLRRGKPTCHIAFNEATAILAGDALQCLAFEILSTSTPNAPCATKRLQMIHQLSTASGACGMAGGQSLDLLATGRNISLEEIERIHSLKTGQLIRASIMMGALCADLTPETLQTLNRFASHIGLAFQIHDDILDIEAPTDTLGKPQGADIQLNKATYPSIVGLPEAKRLRDESLASSLALLDSLPMDTQLLAQMANKMVHRLT